MRTTAAVEFGGRQLIRLFVLVGCLSVSGPPAQAQPGYSIEVDAIARTVGNGVHSYFSGDYQRAYDDLSDALDAGSKDPRTLYFRGLAARRMGRIDESEADFSLAADRESIQAGAWPVSRTLERVQGQDRLALERHRVRSRLAALQASRIATQRRESQIFSQQPEVGRSKLPEGVARDQAREFERGSSRSNSRQPPVDSGAEAAAEEAPATGGLEDEDPGAERVKTPDASELDASGAVDDANGSPAAESEMTAEAADADAQPVAVPEETETPEKVDPKTAGNPVPEPGADPDQEEDAEMTDETPASDASGEAGLGN